MTDEIAALHAQGHQAHIAGEPARAASLYERAYQLADANGDTESATHNRIHCAMAFQAVQLFQSALAVLGPLLASCGRPNSKAGTPYQLSAAVYVYAHLAMNIPAQYREIHEAIQLYQDLIDARDSTLLQLEHKFQDLRDFENRNCIMRLQERMAKDYSPIYCIRMAGLLLNERNVNEAADWLKKWESDQDDWNYLDEEYRVRSRLERIRGDAVEALRWGHQSLQAVPSGESKVDSSMCVARALMAFGEVDKAWSHVEVVLTDLKSESAFDKRGAHLLHGDYWLARAREIAKISPADDQDGKLFPTPDQVADSKELRRALASAREAYQSALGIGQKIDELLECCVWTGAPEKRIVRSDAIQAAIKPT